MKNICPWARCSSFPIPSAMRPLPILSIVLVLLSSSLPAVAADPSKAILLYSRYFNAVGESRYLPDGTYSDVLDRLNKTFEVRVNEQPLTVASLKDVAIVLIANPSDKAVGSNPPP